MTTKKNITSTIKLRRDTIKKLEALKVHPNQSNEEIVEMLLTEHETNRE